MASLPPKVTFWTPLKERPLIVTLVPPFIGPIRGDNDETTGRLGVSGVPLEAWTPPVLLGARMIEVR